MEGMILVLGFVMCHYYHQVFREKLRFLLRACAELIRPLCVYILNSLNQPLFLDRAVAICEELVLVPFSHVRDST